MKILILCELLSSATDVNSYFPTKNKESKKKSIVLFIRIRFGLESHELIFMAPTAGPQASQNTSNLDGQRPLGCMIYCTKESIHVDGRFLFGIHNFNIQSRSLHIQGKMRNGDLTCHQLLNPSRTV